MSDDLDKRYTDPEPDDYYEDEDYELRECCNSCPHFDELNQCCWQSNSWGLCFHVEEGDYCRLGYKEASK